jgi:hypothetical protein
MQANVICNVEQIWGATSAVKSPIDIRMCRESKLYYVYYSGNGLKLGFRQ